MNSKPQQIKMQSTKKGPLTKGKESGAQAGIAVLTSPLAEDGASLATVASAPSGAQQPQAVVANAVPFPALDEESHNQEGNKAKAGSGGRRRGGQRHKVKSQAAIVTPAGGC